MKILQRTIFALIGLFIILIVLSLGSRWLMEGIPFSATVSEADIYQVEGNQVAIVYNYGVQNAKGWEENGRVYLPMNWVSGLLNDRFFYDEDEEQLIYTLPREVVQGDFSTLDSAGYPILLQEEGRVYLSLETVKTYTDLFTIEYLGGEHKRVFINTVFGEYKTARVKAPLPLRMLAAMQSASIENLTLQKGEEGRILEEEGDWTRVMTAGGFMGYLKSSMLTGRKTLIQTSSFIQPEYTQLALPGKVVLGWHVVDQAAANNGLEAVVEKTKNMNVISPTWFSLSDNMGNYTSTASRDYVDRAHAMGLQVWVLIDNFSKEVTSYTLLKNTKARRRLIKHLIRDARDYGFDGINMDLEYLKQETIKYYVQFLRELSVECRKEGLVLSADVPVPAAYNMYYERGKIAGAVDYVINMGYDEHYVGSDKGSVSSIGFVRSAITESLREIPKEKLINAVPVYARLWTESEENLTSKAVSMATADKWIQENQVPMIWDETVGQYVGSFTQGDVTTYLWQEDQRSLKLKSDAMKEADLAGIAVWRLGLETREAWAVLGWED